MSSNPIINDMDRLPTLDDVSADRERMLIAAAKSGDRNACREFVEAHLRYVRRLARNFLRDGVEFEDLIAEGVLGMYDALERFDPARGVRFKAYMVGFIKHRMAICAQAPARSTTSIDTGFSDGVDAHDECMSLHDVIADDAPTAEDQMIEHEETRRRAHLATAAWRAAGKILTPKERQMIRSMFQGRPTTLAQLAEARGVTRQSQRDIHLRALRKLRQAVKAA